MNILILGGGTMQLPAARIARRKGWKVFVAAKSIDPAVRGLADEALEVDLQDREGMVAVAQDLRSASRPARGVHGGHRFLHHRGLGGREAAPAGHPLRRGPERHRQVPDAGPFPRQGGSLPALLHGGEGPEGPQARGAPPEGFSFPLVVKPVDNMGARGVRRVDRAGGLRGRRRAGPRASPAAAG